MFNDQHLFNVKNSIEPNFQGNRFDTEDELLNSFGNPMLDHHHEFMNLSIPQISPSVSRSGSPDFRFCSYERLFESQPDLYPANLQNLN